MKKTKPWKKITLISAGAVLLLAVVIAGILLISRGLKQETYKECIKTAEKYVAEENYEDAIVEYQNAIEAVPDEDDAYLGLAKVYLVQGRTSQARVTLEIGYERTQSKSIMDMINGINDGSLLTNSPLEDSEKETLQRTGPLSWNTAPAYFHKVV